LGVNGRVLHFASYRSMVTSGSIVAVVLDTRHLWIAELYFILPLPVWVWLVKCTPPPTQDSSLFLSVNLSMWRPYVRGMTPSFNSLRRICGTEDTKIIHTRILYHPALEKRFNPLLLASCFFVVTECLSWIVSFVFRVSQSTLSQ